MIDWARPIYWEKDSQRAFVVCDVHDTERIVEVSRDNGGTFLFRGDGTPIDHDMRLANGMSDSELAAARVKIKHAQFKRKQARDKAEIDKLAESFPNVFGSF